MDKFKKYIKGKGILPSEEWITLQQIGNLKLLKKEEHVVQRDSLFGDEVFIEKGIIRAYILDDDGNEKSIAFFNEGEFMSTSSLRTRNGRSLHHYQAMCATTLMLFNSKELKAFLSVNKNLSKIGKTIKDKELARLNERDNCLLQVKAKNKYLNFLKYYPDLEFYISQKHIASYLGITAVSLSRIKAGLKKRN